jgi:hypothetical protein
LAKRAHVLRGMSMQKHDSCHVECVCLLSNKNAKPKDYVEIGVDADDYYSIKDERR